MTSNRKKILHIVGTRPQYIKLFPLFRAMEETQEYHQKIYDTGQHFDYEMSGKILEEFNLKSLVDFGNVKNLPVPKQISKMIEDVWDVLVEYHPDYVFIYGDTNTTLSASIACAKLEIGYGHIEAGVRTEKQTGVQEGINRAVSDKLALDHFCVNQSDALNLQSEGFSPERIHLVGDLMYDAYHRAKEIVLPDNQSLKSDVLVTIHRSENVDSANRRAKILESIVSLSQEFQIILPIHPRLKNQLDENDLQKLKEAGVELVPPLSYTSLIHLLGHVSAVITDSGGLPKEAAYSGVKSLVLRTDPIWWDMKEAGYISTLPSDDNISSDFLCRFVWDAGSNKIKPLLLEKSAPKIMSTVRKKLFIDAKG